VKPLSERAKREAAGIRRDYDGRMRSRQWDDRAKEWTIVEQDVHISGDPIAPGVPACGWNTIDAAIHRHQAMLDRAAARKSAR
jgi:hypothetical protein